MKKLRALVFFIRVHFFPGIFYIPEILISQIFSSKAIGPHVFKFRGPSPIFEGNWPEGQPYFNPWQSIFFHQTENKTKQNKNKTKQNKQTKHTHPPHPHTPTHKTKKQNKKQKKKTKKKTTTTTTTLSLIDSKYIVLVLGWDHSLFPKEVSGLLNQDPITLLDDDRSAWRKFCIGRLLRSQMMINMWYIVWKWIVGRLSYKRSKKLAEVRKSWSTVI